jgi:hypothetical protein
MRQDSFREAERGAERGERLGVGLITLWYRGEGSRFTAGLTLPAVRL